MKANTKNGGLVKMDAELPMILPGPADILGKVQQPSLDWLTDERRFVDYPVLVTCDWHIPHTDTKWVVNLLDIAKRRKGSKRRFPNLVINGDYLDQNQFSKWLEIGPQVSFERELEVGKIIISGLLHHFDQIYIVLGNHDERLLKELGKKYEGAGLTKKYAKLVFGEMLDEDVIGKRVFVSNLRYCETSDRKWLIAHPDDYARGAGVVPVKLANKMDKNVITGHGHHFGMGKTDNGKFWGIDGGGMFNAHSMMYIQRKVSTNPMWAHGFVLLNEKGEARLYSDGLEMAENF